MKNYISVLLIGLSLWSSAVLAVAAEEQDKKVGDNLYVQACGGDPQNYFSTAKEVGSFLREAPNKIVDLKPSPYGRPFITKATSTIQLENGQNLRAELNNFRNIKISDQIGKAIYQRKISGATSIYEVRHQGKTIAWGLGWHKSCQEYFKNTEFTVLRVIFPMLKDGEVHLKEKVFTGAYHSNYTEALNESTAPVIIETDVVYSFGYSSCYYCLPRFFQLDNSSGFQEIKSPEKLKSWGIDISNVDHLMYITWLGQYGLVEDVANYLAENYDTVYSDAAGYMEMYAEAQWDEETFMKHKDSCMKEVQKPTSLSTIGKACFPELEYFSYFKDPPKK